ncbi:LYR motif-containing protein 2 [Colletotrichum tanaceti]|uniref:LYR motif-containing protein 2 n=1 Tax=Colletotrichum tanaceti TaxID=1306861 RepID=A0A4U6XQW0_9PEZI|nr:LYR motif-containing protein 2 [Colletotrichum tanaceti]TKW58204.1 LYR motif-containing protein 2 [Colletotrichum tanaceti]
MRRRRAIERSHRGPAHPAFSSSSDVVDSPLKIAGPMPLKTPLWSLARSYSNGPARSRLGKKALSLDHFLQRSRAISLYREIIRGTGRIADPNTRAESRRFARDEFERHRDVTDLGHIRYLISTGKTEWQGMERYVEGM